MCYTLPRSKGMDNKLRQEALTMKKIFGDGVLAVSTALFACSLAVGLAFVYAMDKFI